MLIENFQFLQDEDPLESSQLGETWDRCAIE